MKVTATLVLTVDYDTGGHDTFDPGAQLRSMVEHAVANGTLSGDDGPVEVDAWEASVRVDPTELPSANELGEGGKMIAPVVHMNGTGAEELLTQLTDAASAITSALDALTQAAPNQRDYYPLGPQAWDDAQRQHASRLARLLSVRDELQAIALNVDEQEEARRQNRQNRKGRKP